MDSKRRDFWISVSLFTASLVMFGQTCRNGYTNWDDPAYVEQNSRVLTGFNVTNFEWAFTTFHAANWHPLTWLSLQLDAQLFGPRPWAFHLTNVLLHGANTVLVFWLLRKATGDAWCSCLAAIFFGFHPLHVESVAWITERKDVLSAFFWLMACLTYGWYASRPQWPRYLIVLVVFGAGLLVKPMLVTLPFVFLLLDFWPLGRIQQLSGDHATNSDMVTAAPRFGIGRILWEKVPFLILSVASSAITLCAQVQSNALRSLDEYPLTARGANALCAYCAYLGQMFWPSNLGLFYVHIDPAQRTWGALAALAFLVLVTVTVCVQRRSFPYLPVGWFWYLGTLVPVIGLVQVGTSARADRYTYVPLIGLLVAIVWLTADLARRARMFPIAAIFGVFLTLACALSCWTQLGYWRSTTILWEHTLEACGDSAVAHMNLAAEYAKRGQHERSARHYRDVVRFEPDNAYAHHDLGVALHRLGRVEDAIQQYREAARAQSDWAWPRFSLGITLAKAGNPDEARAQLEEALRCDPQFAQAHGELGKLLFSVGHLDEAIPHLTMAAESRIADAQIDYDLAQILASRGRYQDVIALLQRSAESHPRDFNLYCLMGYALQRSGDKDAAANAYREATRLNPAWREILNARAWRLATDPDAKHREGDLAVELAQQVCSAPGNRDAKYLDTLAAAYAERGDFVRAIELGRKAAETAFADGQEQLLPAIEKRVRLYRAERPFRAVESHLN
jgi:tetratricopeptide (TPR) repeat protein